MGKAFIPAYFGLLLAAMVAAPASAQQFQAWRISSTPGTCGVQTTMDMQRIPTAGFGLFSARRDRFQMMMSGNMSTDVPPKAGEVVFAGRRAPVLDIQYTRVPSRNALLDDTFHLTIHLDTEYLEDVAQSQSFLIRFDGNDFAPFTLSERGQAVVYMARCMTRM
ncbi:MAG: hypothetical protein AB7E60_04535 [Sphingobium sp.]